MRIVITLVTFFSGAIALALTVFHGGLWLLVRFQAKEDYCNAVMMETASRHEGWSYHGSYSPETNKLDEAALEAEGSSCEAWREEMDQLR